MSMLGIRSDYADYQLLKVRDNASKKEMEASVRKMAFFFHSDKMQFQTWALQRATSFPDQASHQVSCGVLLAWHDLTSNMFLDTHACGPVLPEPHGVPDPHPEHLEQDPADQVQLGDPVGRHATGDDQQVGEALVDRHHEST